MKSVLIDTETSIDEYLSDNKELVYSEILNAIGDSYMDNDISSINVLEIFSKDSTSLKLEIERDDWIKSIDRTRIFFERPDIEEYEKCATCVNILNYLRNNEENSTADFDFLKRDTYVTSNDKYLKCNSALKK
tara:strand:- start:4042 stop:4440 length:399 start_codon:yes stop_codon:yes gene_type:complete